MDTIMMTAIGYQGSHDLIKFLQEKGYRVIGTDMNKNSAAKFYCDKFYEVPSGKDENYLDKIKEVIKKEKPDVILPGSSWEVSKLSDLKGVMTLNQCAVSIALDKVYTYKKLDGIINLPKYIEKPILKPTDDKGGNGIEKSNKLAVEKLEGEEIDVDILSWKGELLIAESKTRERVYGGTLIEGEIVKRPEIVKQVKRILEVIPLSYLSVFQFIGGKLIEINPRIAGAVIDYNLVDLAIKLALGKITKDKIKRYKIPYGKRVSGYIKYHTESP